MFSNIARTLRPLGFAAALLGVVSCTLSAQTGSNVVPNRIVQPVDESSRVTLHGYVLPRANAANDRGAAPDTMQLSRMHLVLQRSASQEAALRQLVAGMHTPSDPNYHKWLTPEQFGQQFGPSDEDVATVQSWLTSHGFQVSGSVPGKQVIEFSGSVAQFREAFHAQIHKYLVNGNTHYATANDPQIPSAIAPVVSGFVALNDFRPKSNAHVLGQASYDPKTNKATPNWTYGGSGTYVMAPADFGIEYDLPNSVNPNYSGTKYDGSGETVAIINESNINLDLVQQFRKIFLPAYSDTNLPTVIIDGNDPGVDGVNDPDGPNYASDETYIDVEWSGAMAPNANIDLVIAADTALESGLFLAAEHAVYYDVAPIMSLSFGTCEPQLGSTNLYLDQLWEQAAAEGITVMTSAGDGGAAGCDNFDSAEYATQGLAVSGFASTPWNVAVGGTDFYYSDYASGGASSKNDWSQTATQNPQASIQHYIEEQPWNDSQFGLNANTYYSPSYYSSTGFTTIGGGGGGASSAAVCLNNDFDATTGLCDSTSSGYPKPSWQAGTGVPSDGVRDVPDVSLFAADDANYSFLPFCYADGDCQPASGGNLVQISGAGGTSFAAPSFAGVMALVDQAMKSPQGQADFVLYPLKAQFPAAFHDITVGTNTEPCNLTEVSSGTTLFPPDNCIAVPNEITASDGTPEGALGLNSNTPLYPAGAGYNQATGLGSIDAAVLVADWGKVTFTSSTTTLTSPAAGASYTHGQSVSISGTVTGTGTPSGNVALMTDSSEPGQRGANFAQVLSGGASTFAVGSGGSFSGSVTDLPGGTYDVWASYSGDGTNGPSNSSKAQITVSPENSDIIFNLTNASGAVGITSGDTTVAYGTQGIFAAEVVPASCYSSSNPSSSCSTTTFTPPTGTVTFADNGTTVNTAAINVEGDAEFNAPFSIGTHKVSASYSGDASYNSSTSSNVSFTVVQDTPNVFAGAANGSTTLQNTFIGGQATIFYVIVENSANTSSSSTSTMYAPVSAPTGTVTVTGLPSGSSSGTQTLVASIDPTDGQQAGVVQFTIPANACTSTCNYTLGISYSGDTNYTALTGNNALSGAITIEAPSGLQNSTITASLSGTSITPNQSVTVSGTVTGSGSTPPTGYVYIYTDGEGTTAFPLITGSGASSTFSGNVTSQVLVQGGNIVSLYYTGDNNYNSSSVLLNSGNSISTPGSDFGMTASSGAVSVSANGTNKLQTSATSTIYLTPTNGFSGTVNLSVPSNCGVSSGLTCSLSASSVSLSYSNTASLPQPNPSTKGGRWNLLATGGGAALACVLLLTIPARRRAWRNVLSLLLFACVAGFGIGCGGSSGGGGGGGCLVNCGGGGGGTTGTTTNPSQSVTLTVTAASGAPVGLHGVAVTATAGEQIHTLGIIAQVE